MNPGQHEQNEQSREQRAQREAAKVEVDRLIAQIEQQMAAEIAAIKDESNPDKKAELEKAFREKFIVKLNQERLAKEASEVADKADKQDEYKEKAKEVKKTLLEVDEVIKKTGSLTGKENIDKIFSGLVDKIRSGELTDREIVDIEKTIGKHLSEGVVLSAGDQQKSNFEKDLETLKEINKTAWEKAVDDLKDNSSSLGKTRDEIVQKFEQPQMSQEDQQKMLEDLQRRQHEVENSAWHQDRIQLYERRFTKDQIDFIEILYSPDKFADYVDYVLNGSNSAEGQKRRHEIQHEKGLIKDKVERHNRKRNLSMTNNEVDNLVEKLWHEEASEHISGRLMEIANHLYLKLQQERPDKFFEEITQEDFMRGIKTTQIAIASAIDNLQITLSKIEQDKDNPLYEKVMKNKLSRETEADYYIDERDGKHYPRLKPLPFGKEIALSEYAQFMNISLNHWTHGMEYFHNTRVMFNHPPGEKGFYSQLAHYAEHLKGTDIDELLLLPDGQVILQAYHLYDKMIEEEFASTDWRHRTNQFTNKLEEINTKLEKQVIDRLALLYPDKSIQQLINAVNTAVGISRGMLLTEPEKSAYGDAVDHDGGGLYASYATNDAGALTVFNPHHVNIRWQGEHMLPMFYFMPLSNDGEAYRGKMWDHKQLWKNAELYMKSMREGVRSKDLPEKLFVDQIVDILNVGGPAKRKGWRMLYSMESHYDYSTDSKGKKYLDPLKTFKSMEMIGYEAIYNFIEGKRAGADVLNALPGTEKGKIKDDLFKYIYKRYFHQGDPKSFNENEYKKYMDDLRIIGRKKALDNVRKNHSYPSGSLEAETEAQASQLFFDRFIVREIAARFPSKYLRMDRNRFHHDGESRWKLALRLLREDGQNWTVDEFNDVMKDMSFAEMLLRQEMSKIIRDRIKLDPSIKLNQFDDIPYKLDENKIRSLLTQSVGHDGRQIIADNARVDKVITLYKTINKILYERGYLDDAGGAIKDVKDYTYTFGLEDTDISLMAWRGTGPRMTARALGDTGAMETNVIPWIIEMPRLLNKIAVSGKHDFSPIIEYLQKAQDTITKVHGTGDDFKYVYKIASMVIQYFKKDTMAKPLFGLFRIGRKNSIAAEYAGRSSAVWEWDAREIDNFCVALESLNLLPREPYDKTFGPKYEDRYINLFGKPVKFGKKVKVDPMHVWNSQRLRKEFGGSYKDIALEIFMNLGPAAIAFLLWKYLQDSLEEAQGKKK